MVEVYRRSTSRYWYFDVTVGGIRKRRSTKRTKKSEAQAVATTALSTELDRQQFADLKEITVREALFDHYLPSKSGAASLVHLQRHCRTLCGDRRQTASIGGHVKMHELTNALLRQFRNRRTAQGLSAQSIDHELKVLSAAYNLVKSDYLVRPGLKFPMARPKGRPRYLLPQEEAALLVELDPANITTRGGQQAALSPNSIVAQQRADNFDLVVMLLDTGCRYGEIANLTWSMVDTIGWRWLHIFRDKVDDEGRLATTARVRSVLQRRWKGARHPSLVFPGWTKGTDSLPRQTTGGIRRAMERVGINSPEKVRRFGRRDVRSLRDTFATKLRMRGVSLDQLQKLLGHSSPEMSQKYAHLSVDQASVRASALLDEIASESECAKTVPSDSKRKVLHYQ